MSVTCEIKNYKALRKQIEDMKKAPQKVLQATSNDLRKRGRGWIADGVVERYNLEGNKSKGKKAIVDEDVGKVEITGSLVDNTMKFKYKGRRLTPIHFSMSPTARPAPGTQYTLKWKVRREGGKPVSAKIKKLTKKQRKNIGRNYTHQSTRTTQTSPSMLQPTGAKSADKVQYIPFQRKASRPGDKMDYPVKAMSLPQMVTQGKNKQFYPEIEKKFNQNLEKRFNHYCDRYIGK